MSIRRVDTRNKAQCTRIAAPPTQVSAAREASAVVLLCSGALTVLALASYHAGDMSLNASGTSVVRNWIGPAGAYWADFMLQGIGIGAYPLGAGLIFAGCRAFAGRRIIPGLRETLGTLLLMISIGTLADLIFRGTQRSFPPGGIAGAMLSPILRQHFAVLGAYILTIALVSIALALTADGVLSGLGLRGFGLVRTIMAACLQFGRHVRRLLSGSVARVRNRDAVADAPMNPPVRLHMAPPRAGRRRDASKSAAAGAPEGNGEAAAETKPDAVADADADSEAPIALTALADSRAARFRRPPVAVLTPSAGGAALQSEAMPIEALELVENEAAGEPVAATAAAPRALRRPKTAEPQIVNVRADLDPAAVERAALEVTPPAGRRDFELPPASLLDYEATVRAPVDPEKLRDNALRLTKTLKDYGIDGHVREIRPGPVVTMYEYVPGPGTKLSKIASLSDDLAMSMEALRVRIVAPIPGKGAVGIEIPNETRETVYLKEIIAHDAFRKAKSRLTIALGKDIEGAAYVADLARMPHLLVAGATGAGKSVSINAMIMSILFKATPDEVRMIMVDPKMLELSVYEGIPHLLLPVVTDPKKAALALRWAVEEMERRYELLSEVGVRSIDGYNTKVQTAEERGLKVTVPSKTPDGEPTVCTPLPYILVIVDELADLMMVASREVEASIMRLAQMARAAGIHLILATQRPSVDVLTGVIKANFPTRIAFQVASRHDSRTIIDANGAEHLLGRGDMLYLSPGAGGIGRVHGAYVSDEEIERAVDFARRQGSPQYDESILAPREEGEDAELPEEDRDEMYDQAIAIVAETRQASISMIQRRLRIGYNRAARMVERMETEGIVGAADGAKPREVLISSL